MSEKNIPATDSQAGEHDRIREVVSETYADIVSRPPAQGCCSSVASKSAVTKLAGYDAEQLEALPADAVVNSFGCGNPLAFSEVKEGDVEVDLGCGAGIDLLIAAKKVGATGKVIGVDMTDQMIAKANENIAAAGLTNVEIRKGLIEDLPVEAGSVDWVISNCVINLSPDKAKVFAEIARVLKPGGHMLVSDIVVKDLPEVIRNSKELYTSCVAGAISEEEYLAGLRDAGLENVEVRERFVYDAGQLNAFVQSDLTEVKKLLSCCGTGLVEEMIDQLIASVVGKVWSAKIAAQKPTV